MKTLAREIGWSYLRAIDAERTGWTAESVVPGGLFEN